MSIVEAGAPVYAPAQSVPASIPLLHVRSLTHRYQRADARNWTVPLIEDLDLEVPQGQITVVLGPSGCGKTTLLNLAAGLLPIQWGEILFRGQSLHGPHPSVGVVFQQPALLPWLTVADNVKFGLTLRHSEPLSAGERRQRVEEALDVVGLREHPDQLPSHLSGGMAQRVALARVLVRQPSLLLLDEPFSALDAVTRAEMQQLILAIVKRTGAGVLLITHDVDEALALGDRVLLMNRLPGRIERSWEFQTKGPSAHTSTSKAEILQTLATILAAPAA